MPNTISRKWVAVSIFTAPGSYAALKILNDRDLLPWLKADYIPYFGFPLLVILCASCLFGTKGLINVAGQINERYKTFNEMEKRFKEKNDSENK